MPTGSLPKDGKKIWERVHQEALDAGDSEETAAKKAWGAVKNAGWHKDPEGKWIKKSEGIEEFSLTIRKATLDEKTGEMRWRADTSDVDTDSYDDNMSFELFADFIERINRDEAPPEPIRELYVTDYWKGGMPYLSLSHYSDLNGDAVPGPVDAVFLDGKFLKARGRTYDTPLGRATWNALRSDLEKRGDLNHNPVRISIAFLDYKHMHKDTGTVFERDFSTAKGMVCRECSENAKVGKVGGKVFLKGQLIHLAMTRVPVNKRTLMEVERSMTTRKEDAASIVGEELATQIDEKALTVGKSEAEVIRADETPVETTSVTLETLSAAILSLTEEVRAMKQDKPMEDDEESEDMETCKACGGTGKVKKKSATSKAEIVEDQPVVESHPEPDLVQALSDVFAPIGQKLDILISATTQKSVPATAAPERRSIAPGGVTQLQPGQSNQPNPGAPMKIGDFVRRSVTGQ